jgi:aspartate racemase
MSLGIIGGMGPMATAYFMELIIQMTKADSDKEHLEMIVYNSPSIPDRTAYIIGKSKENPLPMLMEIAQKLKEQSVTCVAMPCMTAHYFYDDLLKVGIPIVHGIQETAMLLKDAGVKTVGIMATDGTVSSGIFQKELEAQGLTVILPDATYQRKIMDMIYKDIKAGTMPAQEMVEEVKRHFLFERGAEVVILGCTELSLLKKEYDLGSGIVDTLEVLAKRVLEICGKEINPKYEDLFSIS